MLRGQTRQEHRNLYGSYADLANLPAELTSEALSLEDRETLLHSECMYRVCSLIAFGLGLASLDDIEGFVDSQVSISEPVAVGLSECDHGTEVYVGLSVQLPYMASLLNNEKSSYLRKRKKDSDLLFSLMGQSVSFYGAISLEPVGDKSLIVHCGISNADFTAGIVQGLPAASKKDAKAFRAAANAATLHELLEHDKSKKILQDTLLALGQLIANEFARDSFVGVFDGMPLFEPGGRIQAAWHDLVTLTDKQLPGLCPVCGRVVDRWCGLKGGKPKITCCNQHSDAYSNEQRRLKGLGDPEMMFSHKRATKAREMRYKGENDQRPLMNVESSND